VKKRIAVILIGAAISATVISAILLSVVGDSASGAGEIPNFLQQGFIDTGWLQADPAISWAVQVHDGQVFDLTAD
jgi:hypothetical protein